MSRSVPERQRVDELDAVRGLAAMSVLLYHWCMAAPAFSADTRGDAHYAAWNLLKSTPLRIVIAGPEAVMLFFVLSGMVLAMPYVAGTGQPYRIFIVRRFFRLYPAAYAALAAAMVLAVVTGLHTVPGASSWVNRQWRDAPDAGAVGDHLVLLGHFNTARFDIPIWSLVQEARVSLIFPALVALVLVGRWWLPTAAAALLSLVAAAHLPPGAWAFGSTQCVLVTFMVGIEIARRRETLVAWCNRLGRVGRATLALAAVLGITGHYVLEYRGVATAPGPTLLLATAGAGVLIVLALTDPARGLLLRAVPQFLGRVSYGLYLWHVLVLMVLVKVADGRVPLAVLAAVGIAVSLVVADLSQRVVEAPTITLGRRLAGRIRARRQRATEAVPVSP